MSDRSEMKNVAELYWLEPCSERNGRHLGPGCGGFHGRRGRITRHRACRVCACGMVKTAPVERGPR